jgi:hypothetical protein
MLELSCGGLAVSTVPTFSPSTFHHTVTHVRLKPKKKWAREAGGLSFSCLTKAQRRIELHLAIASMDGMAGSVKRGGEGMKP